MTALRAYLGMMLGIVIVGGQALCGQPISPVGSPAAVITHPPNQTSAVRSALALQLVPPEITGEKVATLLVTVIRPGGAGSARAVVRVPTGFAVDRSGLNLDASGDRVIGSVQISPDPARATAGPHVLVVELVQDTSGSEPVAASESLTFMYIPEIGLIPYFLIGCVGVGVGYGLRLLMKVRDSVPAPLPAPEPPPAPGSPGLLTRFVRRHYYRADLLLTLTLGILALAALARNGRPPQAGATIPGVLVLGSTLGLITNNELLRKLN